MSTPPSNGRGWAEYLDAWRDVWTAPVRRLLAAALAGGVLYAAAEGGPDLTGIAAIVAASAAILAAVVDARKGTAVTDQVNDHEARIRVLESKS